MNITEIFVLILLSLVLLYPFGFIRKNNSISILNPLIFFSILMIYFCILSPLFRILINNTSDRGLDFRELFIYGWIGALISSFSIILGYGYLKVKQLKIKRENNFKISELSNIGLILNFLGILSYLIVNGFDFYLFNPFIDKSASFDFLNYSGGLQNYLRLQVNFLITGNYLLGINWIKNKEKGYLFLTNFLLTIGVFLNSGFRWRLFLLIFSLTLYWLLHKKRKRNFYFFGFTIFISIQLFLNTFLELTRKYGAGLSFDNIRQENFIFFLQRSFTLAETTIFLTTSGLISIVPKEFPYVYLKPLLNTILLPIPNNFLINKDSSEYLINALSKLYGGLALSKGSTIMFFGEYYLVFGWIGIILMSFFLGLLFKKCWLLFKVHQSEELALPIYIMH